MLLTDSEQCLEKIPASADKPPITQPTPPVQAQDSRLKGMSDCLRAEHQGLKAVAQTSNLHISDAHCWRPAAGGTG